MDVSLSSSSSEDGAAAPVRPSGSITRKQLKGKIQSGVQEWVDDYWKEKIGLYVMQGDYLALIMEERECITWKSFLWDVPQGVLFAINAGMKKVEVKRWGKRVNDRCPFCGNIQTLLHVLSGCSVSLDQGRYTWRHNSVLLSIIEFIRPVLADGFVLFSDMPGFQAPHGGVIPPDILVTTLKPDLFLVNASLSVIVFFELTCPWDDNILRSHEFKDRKYAPLIADLSRNFRVHNYSVEISVRGQVSKQNRARLKSFLFNCCTLPGNSVKRLIRICSKAALLSSYSIFGARKEPSWMSPNPLVVRD